VGNNRTKQVSIAIVNNSYEAYLAGPASILLTTAWQRFKITGTLVSGQTKVSPLSRPFFARNQLSTGGSDFLWGDRSRPAIPALESALGSHLCVALSSAQVRSL